MATIARVRHSHILSAAAAALLAAPGAFAGPPETNLTTSLTVAVKAGDHVGVTRWSGGKLKGQIVDVTECSILMTVDGKAVAVQRGAIKTVRRYPPPKPHAGQAALAAVEQCGRAACAPATLAVVGVAGLVKGLQGLGRPGRKSTIVYRGARDRASGIRCSPEGQMRASDERATGR